MNYLAFSIVILALIIGCVFYDELYNKNVENFPGWAIGILIVVLLIPVLSLLLLLLEILFYLQVQVRK